MTPAAAPPPARAERAAGTERTSPRDPPLERKLPLLVLALFGIILGAWAAASYYETRHSAEVAAAERLSTVARVVAGTFEQNLAARFTVMAPIARDTAVEAALRNPERPLPAGVQRSLAAINGQQTNILVPAELWTLQGRVAGQLSLDLPADAREFRDDIRRVSPPADHDSLIVGRVHVSGDRAGVWIAAAVRDRSGATIGYVVQQRRFGSNRQVIQSLRDLLGGQIRLYVHNVAGQTWVQFTGEPASPPGPHRELIDSVGMVERAGIGTLMSATAPVRGTPLLVTVERPLSAILERPAASVRRLGALAVLLAVVGAFLAWRATRRLVRPLGELTNAAEAIANGEMAWRVNVSRGDEIGRLGAAFNRMVRRVEESSEASSRAVASLTRSVETQEFLAEASSIVAGSLSDERLLSDLARHCVPRLADYCTIHVAEDDGTIRRIASVHRDRLKQDALIDLVKRFRYRIDGPGEVPEVIRTQRPIIIPVIDRSALRAQADSEETRRLLGQIAPNSFMCVPLLARGRAFGAMSFTMTTSGRRFSDDDLEIAMEVARRTATAIDNTLIYRRSLDLRLEAESASNAKSDFLAKMSHEIRTPINAMMGYAELLQMGIAGPVTEAQAMQLDRIRASGEHLTAMISEILDLSKIEAGRMGVEPTIGVAGEVAEAALALVRPAASTKGVELHARLHGNPAVNYLGDPQRVQQILANLLANAVKFTPAGGRVSIDCGTAARPTGAAKPVEWAAITVRDTGVGIAANDLERIFQPFVQVDGGYTRAHGGTGLGLTISRNLAQMMGGDITVESVVGEGSRFTLWLPMPEPAFEPVPLGARATPAHSH